MLQISKICVSVFLEMVHTDPPPITQISHQPKMNAPLLVKGRYLIPIGVTGYHSRSGIRPPLQTSNDVQSGLPT